MFVDKAKIKIKAGNGGDGAISFHREKYVAAGGPDGGNGGKGGDVIFVADDNFSSLIDFRYKRKYVAQNGERIMADISTDEPQILAHGGRGGRGNCNFATSTRQIPRFAKPGYPGEEFEVTLELKLIADVGLVGFPNVGKSTLISAVSAAKPKIANYHFTTLTPVLGVVKVSEEKSFVMADIPGLIEGASDGVGLGHEFLRHVERCRLIVHVLDASGVEGRDPLEDFDIINSELENFSSELAQCPQIVAANKCDMADEEQIEHIRNYIEQKGMKFFAVSAATTHGTKELINEVAAELEKLPPVKSYEAEPITQAEIEEKALSHTKFDIEIEDGVYYVDAKWLEPVMRTISMDDYSSLQYFQQVLRKSGIIDKLEEMGINEGDTVNILGFEFDYVR